MSSSIGYDWQEELDNFFVAEGLPAALVAAKPNLFSSVASCLDTLRQQYPYVNDVTSDEMVKAIRQALTRDGRFPLTLLVLDEIQQYIGGDSQRSFDVQEAVEACARVSAPACCLSAPGRRPSPARRSLQRLAGRFTIRIELSDADVDAVIRQVILAKQASRNSRHRERHDGQPGRDLAPAWPARRSAIARTISPALRRITRSCRCAAASGSKACACLTRPAPTASCATN